MLHNDWFARCEDGAWVEGAWARRFGSRSSPGCPHCECFTFKWAVEILLYITYAGQCPPARVHDKLMGSWFGHVRPSGWVLGDYFRGYLLHFQSVTTGGSSQLGGHRQRRWSSKCPKLYWCILCTGDPKERELHPYYTYTWSSLTYFEKYHSEGCGIIFSSSHYTEPNEVGSGLHAGGFIGLLFGSRPDFEKETLWM